MHEPTYSIDSSTGNPVIPLRTQPRTEVFTIMPKDADILNGYIHEFHDADTRARNVILEKAMGDIYREDPEKHQFSKKEAKLVSTFGTY